MSQEPNDGNVIQLASRRPNKKASPTSSHGTDDLIERLRNEIFLYKVEAIVRPLGEHVMRSIHALHDFEIKVRWSLVDFGHSEDEVPWACYHLDAVRGDHTWCLNCVTVGYTNQLCWFEGDEPYFESVLVDDQLESVASIIVHDAERCLGLVNSRRAEEPPPDNPSG